MHSINMRNSALSQGFGQLSCNNTPTGGKDIGFLYNNSKHGAIQANRIELLLKNKNKVKITKGFLARPDTSLDLVFTTWEDVNNVLGFL